MLTSRSQNWHKLLDPSSGFFRPRGRTGQFVEGFDEFGWGPPVGYTEAGPWQYRVEVPYDPKGLNAALLLMGYDGCDIVEQANTAPAIFHLGGYTHEIHEQAEMALNCWGQWVGPQPVKPSSASPKPSSASPKPLLC